MDLRRWLCVTGALVATASVAASCRDVQVEEPCGALPDRAACPASRGGTCADRECSAIYACEERRWVLLAECPGTHGADAGADDARDAARDAPTCDGAVPVPVAACPPLQPPDCDIAIADGCPASACKEGCTGFLRCTPQGWTDAYVAFCDDDGVLVR